MYTSVEVKRKSVPRKNATQSEHASPIRQSRDLSSAAGDIFNPKHACYESMVIIKKQEEDKFKYGGPFSQNKGKPQGVLLHNRNQSQFLSINNSIDTESKRPQTMVGKNSS